MQHTPNSDQYVHVLCTRYMTSHLRPRLWLRTPTSSDEPPACRAHMVRRQTIEYVCSVCMCLYTRVVCAEEGAAAA
jgi:hypothetical protein